MDQLAGQNVQVVLGLLEGKGFDSVENQIIIVGTLCGGSLESDFINPESCPIFGSDLVWEATKSEIRKMRSSQEPLKVECFEYKENGVREKLGYFVLSLRTAQIVPPGYDKNIKKNWHKLFGLRNDVKAYKPEIFLSLIIEELKDTPEDDDHEKKNISHENLIEPRDLPKPYLIPDEGLIQLGPIELCQDIFILNITTGTIGNLNLLKSSGKINYNQKYFFCYKLLENDVQSKPFKNDMKNWSMNEKIVIKIRTSYNVFKNYLQYHPNLLIILKHGESILGEVCVNYKSLLGDQNEQVFLNNVKNGKATLTERSYMRTLDKKNDTFIADDRPFIDIRLQLQYLGRKINDKSENADETYKKHYLLNDHIVENKNSEQSDVESEETPPGDYHKKEPQKFDIHQNHHEKYTHTCNKKNKSVKNPEEYHCYCLNISLKSIKLKPRLLVKNIELRFHHPKADTMSTTHSKIPVIIEDQLKLNDIGCKLNFVSSVDEIKNLLLIYPPKISICDGDKTDKYCIGQSVLDVKQLFDNTGLQCQFQSNLISNNQVEIGFIEVAMNLMDLGPYNTTDQQTWEDNFGPPILDDSLTYKIIEELETWKEHQQEIFYSELKKKEERHLNRLSEEWKKRRGALESSLTCSIEQCKTLTDNLNSATNDLRTRRLQSMEKEAKLIKMNEEMKWTYDRRLQELKETSEKLQKQFTEKLSLLEEEKEKYETELSTLQNKNEELVKIIEKQSEDLATCQKNSLVQDQTVDMLHNIKLLEKKLTSAQKSKIFFKEQWGRAVREIQKIKNNHNNALEVQIKSSRDELENNHLEELLQCDSAALTNDKILLGQIQRKIDVIKPKSSYRIDIPEESLYPTTLESCSRSIIDVNIPQSSRKLNDEEFRLQKLIDERDSLLKTGSYSSDDAIIVKLDKEISSIFKYL